MRWCFDDPKPSDHSKLGLLAHLGSPVAEATILLLQKPSKRQQIQQ